MNNLTPSKLSEIARALYTEGDPIGRKLQVWRPYICPFHELLGTIQPGARVLDVGCGSGLFLGLLASTGSIVSGYGFDSSQSAIICANKMKKKLPGTNVINFEHRNAMDPWINEKFEVVSLIDMLHHVSPEHQRTVIQQAAERVSKGGILLYKDISPEPIWQAWANRLHDLVVAHEWVNYVAMDTIIEWTQEFGLQHEHYQKINMLWYGHELAIFRHPD